ncbi:MAG: hypothetical protein P8I93_00345 [Crocinitomicaceae bacterium]|nr:hypothetical protein [Crocinitomicaceae bacterium]
MKRVILGLFVAGTFLVSCGGPSPESTVEGTVELKKDLNASLEEKHTEQVEIAKERCELKKEWEEVTKKELLETYGGTDKGVENMEKKVKAGEEQAIKDWIAYKTAERAYDLEKWEVGNSLKSLKEDIAHKQWAFDTSEDLMTLLHDDEKKHKDAIKKLEDDLKIQKDKLNDAKKKLSEDYDKWYKDEFKGKEEDKEPVGFSFEKSSEGGAH